MSWLNHTLKTIEQVHATIAPDATEEEARKALSAAYPFGERAMSPYKTWCYRVNCYLAKRYPSGKAAGLLRAKMRRKIERPGLSPLPDSVIDSLFGAEI
jgi:hypothetical protein